MRGRAGEKTLMLSPADNERLTRIGREAPMGTLFRRYRVPALLSEEVLEADGAPALR